MILIIGGAYQGKTEYVRSLDINDICNGASENFDGIWKHSAVNNFQMLIRRQLEAGLEPLEEAEKLLEKNPHIVIISTEIGGGIVPMERSERMWREAVGKVCCYLARKSSRVVRVICGIPTIIKETGDGN